MMQVIDEAYVGEIVSMPDGVERLARWIHGLIDQRDTSEAIAKCCVAQIQPLKARAQSLLEANNALTFEKRDQRVELEAQLDAAHAELDGYRRRETTLGVLKERDKEAVELLRWLTDRTDLDLSYQYDLEASSIPRALMKPGLIPEEGWTVHKSHGGVNDREWDMVALEATPIEALRAAHRAFCDGK